MRAASLCLMYWSVIESERLLAGIAFDQDALHSRGIIKRPNRPQTGGSSVDAVQAIAIRLIRGWIWIPIGCLNSHPLRTIPSLCKGLEKIKPSHMVYHAFQTHLCWRLHHGIDRLAQSVVYRDRNHAHRQCAAVVHGAHRQRTRAGRPTACRTRAWLES